MGPEGREVEEAANQAKQGMKAAGTAAAQFFSANYVGAAVTVIKNYKAIFALICFIVFLPLFLLAAAPTILFGGTTGTDSTAFLYDVDAYANSYHAIMEDSTKLLNDAYKEYYPKAYEKGKQVRDSYNKPGYIVVSEDGLLVQEYTYVNNVGVSVLPGKSEMELTEKNLFEMLARYHYLQYYITDIKDEPNFNDLYHDEAYSLNDIEATYEYFKEVFVDSITKSMNQNGYFSASASPFVTERQELTEETEMDGEDGKKITVQKISIICEGNVRVTVSQNTDRFLKYDYKDSKGDLHRGINTVIKDLGGNPNFRTSGLSLTPTQEALYSATYTTPTAGDGLCAAWVSDVYSKAGFTINGNAIDMWLNYTKYNMEAYREMLEPGMLVAVEHANNIPISDGYVYGHVGIYIGNDLIRSNGTTGTGGTVTEYTINEWIDHYGAGTVKFGYPTEVEQKIAEEREANTYIAIGDGYLQAAIEMANDDSIGYCREVGYNLLNPDVDCGSFVTFALRKAGVTMDIYEPNSGLEQNLINAGFTYHEGMDGVQSGDILYVYGHTEIYIGEMEGMEGLWEVGAHDYKENKADEVSVLPYYGDGYWEGYYRPDDLSIVGAANLSTLGTKDSASGYVNSLIEDIYNLLMAEYNQTTTKEEAGISAMEVMEYSADGLTVSDEELLQLAQAKGISEENLIRCEKLTMRETTYRDPYLQYLMACATVNHVKEDPKDLYGSWVGIESDYATATDEIVPDENAKRAVYLALMYPDSRVWYVHGLTVENVLWEQESDLAFYTGMVQDIREAIYVSEYGTDYYNFAAWSKGAGWYDQTKIMPSFAK